MSPPAACAEEIPKHTVEAKVVLATRIANPALRFINLAITILFSPFFECELADLEYREHPQIPASPNPHASPKEEV
jgi:hypothetical protein